MDVVPAQRELLAYPRSTDPFDEVYGGGERASPHWQYLLNSLQALGPAELAERERKAMRMLRDDGATYNVQRDPEAGSTSAHQHWRLDPVPLLLTSEEWRTIEAGLLERAELLNMMLEDIYSERNLIRHRIIPPELLFDHAGFLRACQGLAQPGANQLLLYAADMVRSAGGEMCVISDRTQAPSGMGYALENRTVMSRILPSLFRDSQVHRLAPFFTTLRDTLQNLAPTDDVARVVVLTPGPFSETYFEHAYLANYLGYALVQGTDLVVRDGCVWLKSMTGLTRVHAILRRVDDYFCDPVELKSDSYIGVPGLLAAVRAGNVLLANPLGSGALENRGLLRYFAAIGKFYLGREPRLPSVRTWWCGDEGDLAYVIAHLEQLIIKPCWRRVGAITIIGAELSVTERDTCIAMLRLHPTQYIAQEYLPGVSMPAWQEGGLQPRPGVLRSFAVAGSTSYKLMAGGLTRVGISKYSRLVSNQRGSSSKDTWVLASEPEHWPSPPSSLVAGAQLSSARRSELPSRVVENLFWMGRYAERAETTLRLMRCVLMQINGAYPLPGDVHQRLLIALTDVTVTYPGFIGPPAAPVDEPDGELLSLISDGQRTGSISANLQAMLSAADSVQELLSADTQRIINAIRDQVEAMNQRFASGLGSAPEESLDPLVTSLLALAGLYQESMVRGAGWRFINIGRALERSLQTAAMVRSLWAPVFTGASQGMLLETLLLSAESLITYRRNYRDSFSVASGLELILLDTSNPRSLLFQLQHLQQHLEALSAARPRAELALDSEHRLLLEASTAVQHSDLSRLASAGADPSRREQLDVLLQRVATLLRATASALSDRYFDHAAGPRQLILIDRDGEQ